MRTEGTEGLGDEGTKGVGDHAGELTCTSCGYVLHDRDPAARCTECGEPITEALRRAGDPRDDAKWMRRMRRWTRVLVIAFAAAFLVSLAGLLISESGAAFDVRPLSWTMFLALIAGLAAAWAIAAAPAIGTTPAPGGAVPIRVAIGTLPLQYFLAIVILGRAPGWWIGTTVAGMLLYGTLLLVLALVVQRLVWISRLCGAASARRGGTIVVLSYAAALVVGIVVKAHEDWSMWNVGPSTWVTASVAMLRGVSTPLMLFHLLAGALGARRCSQLVANAILVREASLASRQAGLTATTSAASPESSP